MSETKEEMVTRLTRQIKEHAQELEDSAPFAAYGPIQERASWQEHCANETAWIRHEASVVADILEGLDDGDG